MSLIGRFLKSKWFPITGFARTVVAVTAIYLGVEFSMFEKIDISNLAVPDEYLPFMLIASMVGTLAVVGISRKLARKNAHAEENANKVYLTGTVFAILFGIAVGMYGAIPVTNAIFIGAGQWAYTGMAAVVSGVAGTILLLIIHFGLREFIIKSAWYARNIADAVDEASADIEAIKARRKIDE